MVEADCDIIVCIVGWAVRNGSVEDKADSESREVRNAGYSDENWSQDKEWTGWIWRLATKTVIHIWEKETNKKKNRWKECTDTHDEKLLYTVKQGECTRVLLNIPHLLLLNWLIERVGARPLASLSLENWGRRRNKKKQESSPKQRWINLFKRKK